MFCNRKINLKFTDFRAIAVYHNITGTIEYQTTNHK